MSNEIGIQPPFVQGSGTITRAESPLEKALDSIVEPQKAEEEVVNALQEAIDSDKPSDAIVKAEATLSESPKEEFDPNITTKGLEESGDMDGGRFAARSTGHEAMSEATSTDKFQFRQPDQPEAYELTGFTASYMSGNAIASVEPRAFFNTVEEAQASIVNGCYTHTYSGGTIQCNIIKDAPIICVNEVMRFQYLDGVWKRTR